MSLALLGAQSLKLPAACAENNSSENKLQEQKQCSQMEGSESPHLLLLVCSEAAQTTLREKPGGV